jgi:hypothetical protein
MTRTRTIVPALAAAGVLALGGGSAWAYGNGQANPDTHGQERATAICEARIDGQILAGEPSPSGGPKEGLAPANCNHFFGHGGHPTE